MTTSSIASELEPRQRKTGAAWYWSVFAQRHRLPPIEATWPNLSLLRQVVHGFAGVPYENASEILSLIENGPRPRLPEQMIEEHLEIGTGATCYALARALHELLCCYGFDPQFHLGRVGDARPQKSFAPNHAALSVEVDEGVHICDPGMLLHEPLRVGKPGEIVVHHGAREVTVLTQPHADSLTSMLVQTVSGFRQLAFIDLTPIDELAFMKSWQRSFEPLLPAEFLFLSQFDGDALWTVSDRFVTKRDRNGIARRPIGFLEIAGRWGLPEELLERAWHCTPHSHGLARIRAKLRRGLCSALDVAKRRVDYFP